MKTSFFVFLLFFVVVSPVFSQDHNSSEHHRQWNPQHAGYDGRRIHSGEVVRIPNEVWRNHHGAIALDALTGSVWWAENQRTLNAARREALRRCGRKNCEIVATATNSCLAAGDSFRRIYFGSGSTRDEAIQEIHSNCGEDGRTCNIGYVHCNTPVRIR